MKFEFRRYYRKKELSSARFYSRHYMIFVIVGIFSILIAWLKIGLVFGLPGFIYILLGPSIIFTRAGA